MNPTNLIPAIDPIPLPAPGGLFIFLLVFTLVLHFIFMNITLGGGILMAASRISGKPHGSKIAHETAKLISFALSLTITTGVAPLLFQQVVYGNYFYSSSILLSWKWMFVLVALTVGYYSIYLYKFAPGPLKKAPQISALFSIVAALSFAYVGLLLVTNTLVSTHPVMWRAVYAGRAAVLSVDTLLPRLTHMFTGSIALGGVALVVYADWRGKLTGDERSAMKMLGRRAFVYATLVNVIVGFWFLISLPREIMMIVMGGDILATAMFFTALIAAFGGVYVAYKREGDRWGLPILALVAMVSMIIVRRGIEHGYFSQYFTYADMPVHSQWIPFAMFAVLLLAGLAVLGFMLYKLALEVYKKKA